MRKQWKVTHPQVPESLFDDEQKARDYYNLQASWAEQSSDKEYKNWILAGMTIQVREVGDWRIAL